MTDTIGWLLSSDEPWTRHRTLIDLQHRDDADKAVVEARADLMASGSIVRLIEKASDWPGYPLKRHNDAAHPLYALATLADFGLRQTDTGIDTLAHSVLEHFDGDQFQTLLWLPKFLTKEDDSEGWAWMLCDGPTLLYSLLSFGYRDHPPVERAIEAIVAMAEDNGWRCGAADSLPAFSGPGRKADTCPMATTYILKALSLVPEAHASDAVISGIEALLDHWEHQADYKLRMFGIGTDFRKLKYPFVWYDILHVTDVLSRFDTARRDPRLGQMVDEITAQADEDGRYTPTSMFRSWTGWSFADKKHPSPWLTFLVERICSRMKS